MEAGQGGKRSPARGGVCARAPGGAGYADRPASSARSPSTVTPVLSPSFSRRSRDHGRSSREADQDQNRRGEAVSGSGAAAAASSPSPHGGPRGPAERRPEAGPDSRPHLGRPGRWARGGDGGGARVPEPAGLAPPLPRPFLRKPGGGEASVPGPHPSRARGRGDGGAAARPTAVVLRVSPENLAGGGASRPLPALRWRREPVHKFRRASRGRLHPKREQAGALSSNMAGGTVPNWAVSFQRSRQTSEASLSPASVPAARPRGYRMLSSHPG